MDYDSPPSGIPSPPVSCPPSPSSFASDPESLPSNLSASVFSLLSHSPGSPLSRIHTHLTHHSSGFNLHDHLDHTSNLVMPSLALPGPLHVHQHSAGSSVHGRGRRRAASQPSKGELVGKLNILVIGKLGAGKTTFCQSLIAGTEEIAHIAGWEDTSSGRVLHASTVVTEQHESNVKIVRVPGWNENDDAEPVLASLLHIIQDPFRELDQLLDPKHKDPSASLKALLSSSATPLYTVAVFLHSNPPTPLENQLLSALSPAIPIIPFPSLRLYDHPTGYNRHHSPQLSRTPSYHDFRSHDSSRVHSQSSSLVSSPYGSRNHSRHDSRGRPLSLSRPISRSRSPELAKTLPRAPFHPRSIHELREIIFRSPSSVELLRRDATEKFLSWRTMERLIDEFTHPSMTLKAPNDLLMNEDAFERFTFDLILGAAQHESDDEIDDLGELPRGRGIDKKSLHLSRLASDLSLSQTVAMRKRAMLQHRETATTLRPAELSAESSPGLPPLEDTIRGRSYTIRPVKGPARPVVRVPLSELSITDNHPLLSSLSSRSVSVSNSAYVSAISSRSSSKTPSSGTPLSGSFSASQPFESDLEGDGDGSHFEMYHGSQPRRIEDRGRSIRDPLHLPSLFSLAISLVPDMRRRLLRKVHPLMLVRRAFGLIDSKASSTTKTTASTYTPDESNVASSWNSAGPSKPSGPGLGSTLMFGFACFCAGLGWGVILATRLTKRGLVA